VKRRTITACIVAGVLAVGAVAGGATRVPDLVDRPATFDAVVKVMRPNGLGSGVSLPGGVVLTAAHVVTGATTVSLKLTDGKTVGAEVMWASPAHDVALLRTDASIPAARLSCDEASVGDEVRAVGAPLGVEFISSFGRIAGKSRPIGQVKSVLVTDITTINGNSGGPLFNSAGEVVGISSMIMLAPLGDKRAPTPSTTGFGFAVPSSVICRLMGRVG
jgi:S1-C subfamily serine protease